MGLFRMFDFQMKFLEKFELHRFEVLGRQNLQELITQTGNCGNKFCQTIYYYQNFIKKAPVTLSA